MHHNQKPGLFTPNKWKVILTLLFIFGLLYYFFSSTCLEWMNSRVTCPDITVTKQIINTIIYLPIVAVVSPIVIFYNTIEQMIGAATGVLLVTIMIIGLFLEVFYLYTIACLFDRFNSKFKKKLPIIEPPEKPYEDNKPKEGVMH